MDCEDQNGRFAAELIALGRSDARAHHGELVALLGRPHATRAQPQAS